MGSNEYLVCLVNFIQICLFFPKNVQITVFKFKDHFLEIMQFLVPNTQESCVIYDFKGIFVWIQDLLITVTYNL